MGWLAEWSTGGWVATGHNSAHLWYSKEPTLSLEPQSQTLLLGLVCLKAGANLIIWSCKVLDFYTWTVESIWSWGHGGCFSDSNAEICITSKLTLKTNSSLELEKIKLTPSNSAILQKWLDLNKLKMITAAKTVHFPSCSFIAVTLLSSLLLPWVLLAHFSGVDLLWSDKSRL